MLTKVSSEFSNACWLFVNIITFTTFVIISVATEVCQTMWLLENWHYEEFLVQTVLCIEILLLINFININITTENTVISSCHMLFLIFGV